MRSRILFWTMLVGIVLAGCRERPASPSIGQTPTPSPKVPPIASTTSEPHVILDRMVTAYQTALSYSDRGTVQIIGKMSQSNSEPIPWNCTVAFQKPNRLRLEVNEGIFVSDGEDCFAQIRPLPHQVLYFPSPEQWTLETLFQDIHFDAATALGLPPSVLRFPPQLVLLFANNPLNTFCPKGAEVEWVEQRNIGQTPCDVIQISHTDGNRILWISQENQILLRLDYEPVGLPVPEGFESIEAIRIEMTDARFDWTQFDWNGVSETFQIAGRVSEFLSDTLELPAPEEHRRRLKLMSDSDTYRVMVQHGQTLTLPEQSPPPKTEPRSFTIEQVWTQPLVGIDTMAWLPGETPKLFIPCEGNLVATLDLQGNILQKISPEGLLEDSIIMNIQAVRFQTGNQRNGILTLDEKFYLFDEAWKLLATHSVESDETITRKFKDVRFMQHQAEEWLLLGIQQDSVQENTAAHVIRTVDLQGEERWKLPLEGIPNQVSTAVMDDQNRVFVSQTASEDSILVLSADGTVLESVVIPFGRHVIWFQVLGSVIYALLECADTNDFRFIGFQKEEGLWRGKWTRWLPGGEYEVDPVYVSSEQKWLVPSPSGEIFVFDLVGNEYGTFSLNVVPTGLLCVEVNGTTLLIVASGETVSAWKIGKL